MTDTAPLTAERFDQICESVAEGDAWIGDSREMVCAIHWYRAALAEATRRGEEAQQALKSARDDDASSWECLMMVRDALGLWYGAEHAKETAPMFFDDAIRNALYQAAVGGQYLGVAGLNESIAERAARAADGSGR